MADHTTSDPTAALSEARRAENRTRAAARWWSRYMLFMGILAFIVTVPLGISSSAQDAGMGSTVGVVVWCLGVGLLSWWAGTHDVQPKGANARYVIPVAIWFGSYAIVIGPIVRWKAGTSLLWWSLASAVMASPFLVAAWWARRRTS